MKIKSLLVAFAVVTLLFTACSNDEGINSVSQEKSLSNLDATLSSKTTLINIKDTVSQRNIKKALSEAGAEVEIK